VNGVCDVAETCTGTGPSCPPDAGQGTAECRSAAGDCDVAESCDGVNGQCPPDTFQPATVECRAAAGVCDLAESCTGTGPTCPADQKSTAVCRAAAGACDVAETCDGASNTCPADAVAPVGTVCRPATGTCDVAESCDGSSTACPADASAPNGTPCNDSNVCTAPDTCQGGVCTGTPDADACADHFLLYKVKAASAFPPTVVALVDQFETDPGALVRKVKHLGTPADKNAEGVVDATTHLMSYTIKSSFRHVRRVNVLVQNQIGALRVDTLKADLLLIPSNKNLLIQPPAPNNTLINVDHYKCYKVKVTAGTPRLPKGITVSVGDQFNAPPKVFALKKAKHLCNPVSKNGELIKNADAHLLCYIAKGVAGQPKHVRRSGVQTNDQFRAEVLQTVKESELCIPSVKTLP
jgi:hypothetical protein